MPQHVLRFWETRFSQIKPLKRGGGRRFYRPDDVLLIRGVRHLLYGEGYTIKGVQRILKEEGVRFVQQVGSGSLSGEPPASAAPEPAGDWEGEGWPGDDLQAGSGDEFPSVVRPQPYNSTWQGQDVMASPPVAGWREAAPDQTGAALAQDPYAPQGYGGAGDPAQGWPAAGETFPPQPEMIAGQGAAASGVSAPWPEAQPPEAQSSGPAPLARSTPVVAHRPDVWNDAPETSHASAPEGFHAGGAWDATPGAASGVAHARPALATSQRARLQEALAELLECRRLLAHARGELDSAD